MLSFTCHILPKGYPDFPSLFDRENRVCSLCRHLSKYLSCTRLKHQSARNALSDMGLSDEAITKFQLDATKLRLPASEEFFAKSALDEEERKAKISLNFLKRMPKRKKPQDGTQANWAALGAALEQESSKFTKDKVEPASTDWHEIPEAKMTPELQRDLRIVENRQHLDPKRFYKSSGTGRRRGELPSRVQIGTVVVGAHEFYSGRLTNKERKGRIIDQVLADERIRHYTKNKFKKLQNDREIKKRVVDPAAKKKRRKRGGW